MIRTLRHLALLATLLALSSCAGYHLGGTKPAALANVKTIAVPMFANATQHPRASVLATSSVANAIIQDGTYRVANHDQADAVLEGELKRIEYRSIRGSRFDSAYPEELANTVTLEWTLRDARDPTKVLAAGSSQGTSQLFVSANLQTARNNALPEALDRASEALVSALANGY
jgi:outer membrane lipopolysaccharide assembly protein LptE/RlpB